MVNDNETMSIHYTELTRTSERRLRKIFVGSTCLSLLVVVNYYFLRVPGGMLATIARVSFPPLLLWSFTLTGYAFHCLWCVASERRQLLEERAVTDPETGVRTLDYIKALLRKEYERAIQTSHPSSVAYVDLQHLNLVNQRFGHAVGDIVLSDVAKTIQKNVGDDGVVGRLGGDEFLVVLGGMDLENAKSVAARIERSVRDYRLDLGKDRKVDFLGCHVGVVACPAEAGFADEVISMAQRMTGPTEPESRRGRPKAP